MKYIARKRSDPTMELWLVVYIVGYIFFEKVQEPAEM